MILPKPISFAVQPLPPVRDEFLEDNTHIAETRFPSLLKLRYGIE